MVQAALAHNQFRCVSFTEGTFALPKLCGFYFRRTVLAQLAIKLASEKRAGNSEVIDSPKTANFLFFVDPSL
jgi:hypothetical protein